MKELLRIVCFIMTVFMIANTASAVYQHDSFWKVWAALILTFFGFTLLLSGKWRRA